ncbi:hypothetical protein [Clostridium saccharoperbutylacetonicum]|uniref:hypothetical protein n=1 Tax=Clostridium saccharoperbutylacetonicum TaxID=36745 RepID=UPI0039EA39B2
MKTVVDRNKSTFSSIEFNKTFKFFADNSGFKHIACRPYMPQAKGKVESLAHLTNCLTVYNGEFEDYNYLDKIVQDFMQKVNNEISQAIDETLLSRLNKELEHLMLKIRKPILRVFL